MKNFLIKHSNFLRNMSHWAIFIFASLAFATSIADVSAQYTVEILMKNPELAEGSVLVVHGYLPKF